MQRVEPKSHEICDIHGMHVQLHSRVASDLGSYRVGGHWFNQLLYKWKFSRDLYFAGTGSIREI